MMPLRATVVRAASWRAAAAQSAAALAMRPGRLARDSHAGTTRTRFLLDHEMIGTPGWNQARATAICRVMRPASTEAAP
ncbi:hypothetical protein ACFQU2_19120 [Siccirubricoccus deserti]